MDPFARVGTAAPGVSALRTGLASGAPAGDAVDHRALAERLAERDEELARGAAPRQGAEVFGEGDVRAERGEGAVEPGVVALRGEGGGEARRDLVGIRADSTFETILACVRQAERTRFPVYQGSLDDVIGVLHVSALAGMSNDPGHTFDIRAAINPAPFVPVTRKADAVLEDMRTGGHAMVIVVDEYGVTAGVLTLHDLFEGLVGRMEADGSGNAVGQTLPDGSRLFAGVVRLGEFEEATGIRIPEDEREEADTLNGLFMLRLGRIPGVGDSIELGDRRLVVEGM